MLTDKDYCMSSFLMYRRVVNHNIAFYENKVPNTIPERWEKVLINNSEELEKHLRDRIKDATSDGKAVLALSGGIDSAILAKMMPEGSTAYTFKCIAKGKNVVDETERASKYAKKCRLNHKIVEITWEDMDKYSNILMKHKNAPIHSIEVQIYKAALQAKKDGFTKMIFGETADVNYGGLSNILSKDWTVGDFIERYSYLKPWCVLRNPKVDFSYFTQFENNGYIDVHEYLRNFDIIESLNSYKNACETAGIEFIAPYADTYLNKPLDLSRIRKGENKYIIREIFDREYRNFEMPEKIPMPRPTAEWLKSWEGPKRKEFIKNSVNSLTGDQKWLVWTLERFLNIMEE